jgi:hypothetical protein
MHKAHPTQSSRVKPPQGHNPLKIRTLSTFPGRFSMRKKPSNADAGKIQAAISGNVQLWLLWSAFQAQRDPMIVTNARLVGAGCSVHRAWLLLLRRSGSRSPNIQLDTDQNPIGSRDSPRIIAGSEFDGCSCEAVNSLSVCRSRLRPSSKLEEKWRQSFS